MIPPYCHITFDALTDDGLEVAGRAFHHLIRVRRLGVGDVLRAALPDGRVLRIEIAAVLPDRFQARILGEEPPAGLSPCRITLAQAALKGEKMELVVQKATELGVDAIVPVLAARSIPRWTPAQAADRAERWARIAEAAADQSERSLPPRIDVPRPLAAAIADLPAPVFLLHERDGLPVAAAVRHWPTLDALTLCIGPEGGWDPAEVDLLTAAGAHPLHLGGRILRAETAAIAAVTIAQLLWGDLGLGA